MRYDLIPAKPLEELAQVYTIGAKKYDDRNWEKGIGWMRIFAAMLRHAFRWLVGERYDQETGQTHLSSVAWCAFALSEYEYTHPELDDRPRGAGWVGQAAGAAFNRGEAYSPGLGRREDRP